MASPSVRVLTVHECAERLRVTDETIRRWLRTKRLEGIKLSRRGRAGWRIAEDEIEKQLGHINMDTLDI